MSTEPGQDYRFITPSLNFKNTAEAIDFYTKAFGAVERFRVEAPNGAMMHAEMQFADSILMLSDACEEWHAPTPAESGCPVLLSLRTDDCDALFNQAVAAGCEVLMPMADQFWGERSGTVRDPFGYRWCMSKHIEDVSPEEMQKRMAEMGMGS
ncbi:MAG: VOC family protein [Opitutales bacterium]